MDRKHKLEVEVEGTSSPKRFRGGGPIGNDDAPIETELFDEDDMVEEMEPPEEFQGTGNDVVYQDVSEDMISRWERPPVADPSSSADLNFQWLDIDVIGGEPLARNPHRGKKVVGSTAGRVPILRVYGTSEHGNSVVAFIHGFTPYGYFALPAGCDFDNTPENLAEIRNILSARLQSQARGADSKAGSFCHAVNYVSDRKSIMGFDTPHKRFFRIMVAMPTMIPTLKRIMENGIHLPGVRPVDQANADDMAMYQPFECNIPFVLRFMIDRNISGAGWLTLPKNTYGVRQGTAKKTLGQVRSQASAQPCW